MRLTDHVLGLVGLLSMNKNFVPTTLKMLKFCQSDNDIARHIEEFFEASKEEYKIKMKRINFWMNSWKKLMQHNEINQLV